MCSWVVVGGSRYAPADGADVTARTAQRRRRAGIGGEGADDAGADVRGQLVDADVEPAGAVVVAVVADGADHAEGQQRGVLVDDRPRPLARDDERADVADVLVGALTA